MSMINTRDIMETIDMITSENLDVRTVTMGISLLDCIDSDPKIACEKIYQKITTKAANLVPVVEKISADYGIPIVNKRISVTPIAMLLGACPSADPVEFAKTLDRAAKKVGVNFIGGYGALVHKGFSAGDKRLIESIPEALACTDIVCSSVNIGSTKSGINMDAVRMMGQIVRKTAERTADNMCLGAAKLVVFCNAPEDNPFMAGAFHGVGEPDCEIHVGVSGPGAVRAALAKLPKSTFILVAMTLISSANLGEMMRSSYLAVEHGQTEAALSVGMTEAQALRRIILPQAVAIAVPNFGNNVISIFKETALAFSIGTLDLMGRAQTISQASFGATRLEVYISVAAIYWAICLILQLVTSVVERATSRGRTVTA